jgi:DNA-binding transcriptional LysR family regulator
MARVDMFTGLTEFMAVADLGSFRAAAAQLRVTPAAVSQSVKALESLSACHSFCEQPAASH